VTPNRTFGRTARQRPITIAPIIIYQSDKRQLPKGRARTRIQQGGFSSLDDCHAHIAMGCNSPAGLFLNPGETSLEFAYNCKMEELYPGTGSCANMSLETIDG